MKRLVLLRLDERPDRTLGRMFVFNGVFEVAHFFTLELPDRDNRRNISRIPAGKYIIEPHVSPTLGDCFRLLDVPGRDAILVHAGNTPDDTRGCILLGLRLGDVDRDGTPDVVNSRAALQLLGQFVREQAQLVIVEA